MKKLLFFAALVLALVTNPYTRQVHAEELTPELTLSNGGKKANLTDKSHYTTVTFSSNDTITVSSKDGSLIHGLYISWDSQPVAWVLTTDTQSMACGANGFLHEYIDLETPSTTLTIHIPADSMRVDQIRIFNEGDLPHDVQVWNPPCERADIMVVSSHSDDEILFFGGVLPTYSYLYDAEVQVVYMCEFWTTTKVREHEKLDGIWEAGIRNYPVCGNFYDKYAEDAADARKRYDYDSLVTFLVKQIRAFQPQVLVTHDIYGEYGHGFHILTCQALMDAVEFAADASLYPESKEAFGTWNTPKTYLHIFPANTIKLDLHIPIEEDYAGRTALEILKEAYKKHDSQQWCRFYVSDDYEHSCADFGLYRTLVGPDTTNDLLCNLKTYKVQAIEEQARLEAEAAALAAQKAEEERLEAERLKEEQAKLEAEKKAEQERLAAEQKAEEERLAKEEQARQEIIRKAEEEKAALKAEQETLRAAEAAEYNTEIKKLTDTLTSVQQQNKLLGGGILLSLLVLVGSVSALLIIHHKKK
jgi:LmbE family N-acetylglucosaminyl deacetylase